MANKHKGYIDIQVGGKKRTLHFSMNFWSEFTEQLNISLQDIGNVFENGISLKGLRALIYSAILANDQEQGNEFPKILDCVIVLTISLIVSASKLSSHEPTV